MYFIKTERLGLRQLSAEDIEGGYADWLNDGEVCQYNSHHRYPQAKSDLVRYIQSVESGQDKMVFAIIHLEDATHIGNISLQHINFLDRNAELAFIIGEKEYWGNGYAREAGQAVIEHAFTQLNLHRLYLGTLDENVRMQRLALKLGFSEEGRRKGALYKNGAYHDILEYGMVRQAELM